jgi:PAS domain S-box-containing protein
MLAFPGLFLIGAMLLRGRDYLILACAIVLTVTGLGVAEIHGVIPTVPLAHSSTDYVTIFFVDVILAVIAIFGGLLSRDARLNLEGIRAAVDDLTAANDELRRSEAKYHSFIELASDAIFAVDRDGIILEVNRQASVIAGIAEEELPGTSITSVISPLDVPAAGTAIMRRGRIVRADRRVVEVEINSAMLPGGPILCFCRDVSERRRAEEALRESEEKHRTILRAAMDGFCLLDTKGRLLEVNDAYCGMSGYSEEELLNMQVSDLEANEAADSTAAHIQRIMERGLDRFESRYRRKDGSVFDVEVCVQYRPGGSEPLVAFLRDISERKRAEAEREHLQLQLIQAQKLESVGRLAGGVAHDFNNLLTVINGYAGFLSEELAAEDPRREYALEIRNAGERAASLTRQLLMFSRKQAIAPRAINLNGVVSDVERMLRRLIGEDIELAIRLAPQMGAVMADPDQIQQVIVNLAVNARDAMPNGGRLEISTADVELDGAAVALHPEATPGRYAVVTVTDNGTGMPEEVLRKVFEPFFTTKEHGKGTGLGLAMAYGILQQSGGWIDVQSEIGSGSTFKIYLPSTDAEVATDAQKQAAVEERPGEETVLIVEDQDAVRRLAKKILQSRGYHVLEAANGEEACAAVRQYGSAIGLLLTDVVMPGVDGRTLSAQMRQWCPDLRVILMSGYSEDVIAKRDALAGGLAYIQKPFDGDELAAMVRDVLRR